MLVTAPARLDEAGVESLLDAVARARPAVPDGIDCSGLRFADPYGILCLLALGLSGAFRRGSAWGLALPADAAVLDYWERCGALELVERLFVVASSRREGAGRPEEAREPVLLAVSAVREPGDVHRAVARIKARADLLLVSRLGYSPLAADRFTVALAEVCQNIVDHSGSPGFAAAQYYLRGPGGAPEVRLAVVDAGVGVRASLAPRYAAAFRGRWDDRAAVRHAFRLGVTRFDDPGRGLGLKAVADLVRGWGGTLRLRSGAAAVRCGAALPGRTRDAGLVPFPGTQIAIRLPHLPEG